MAILYRIVSTNESFVKTPSVGRALVKGARRKGHLGQGRSIYATVRIDTSDGGNRPHPTSNVVKRVKMAKTGSPWGKTHSKSKIEEWLRVRQKFKPAKVRPSLLFAALQEVVTEVKEIVSSKASHDELDTSVPGDPFLIPVCSSFSFGTELR
jgi:hypothetical protein